MTWTPAYDPLGHWWLSTLVTALPIVVLLGLLAGLKVAPAPVRHCGWLHGGRVRRLRVRDAGETGADEPGGRAVLQQAEHSGAVDQGRQAGGELDPSFLSSVPGE